MTLKLLPNSIEAERAVLGSVLIDNDTFATVSNAITEKDFFNLNHSSIFEVYNEMRKTKSKIDVWSISQALTKNWKLEEVWWNEYLVDLTYSTPYSSNVKEYLDIIKQKSIRRSLKYASDKITNFCLEFNNDPNFNNKSLFEVFKSAEKEIFDVTQDWIKSKITHLKDIVLSRFEEFAEVHEDPEYVKTKVTNLWWNSVDNKLWWLKSWDLCILAARPAMWKTAFALNIAKTVCNQTNENWEKKKVAIFSLEMGKEQLVDRMICSSIWVDWYKLKNWELTNFEFSKIWKAMEELSSLQLYISDWTSWNLGEFKSSCREIHKSSWLDLIIIDYLQLMSNPWKNKMRTQEISEISRELKKMAKELNLPIIALSQLSRLVETREDKRPVLSDLRESGSIEQDADSVLMLYREDYYCENKQNESITNVLIRKNRSWPVWSAELIFNKKFQLFTEM